MAARVVTEGTVVTGLSLAAVLESPLSLNGRQDGVQDRAL
jgi:hypothetical protein